MGEAKRRGTFEQRRAMAIGTKIVPKPKTATLKSLEDIPEYVVDRIRAIGRTPRVNKGNPIIIREKGSQNYTMHIHPDDFDMVMTFMEKYKERKVNENLICESKGQETPELGS